MAREEKDLYNLDEPGDDGFQEDKPEEVENVEEFDHHIMYHNFYGY
ncbi:MAG: hypothetical protein ACOY30_01905 [Bacillota bacterium]